MYQKNKSCENDHIIKTISTLIQNNPNQDPKAILCRLRKIALRFIKKNKIQIIAKY